MTVYSIGIDIGTTAIKSVLLDSTLRTVLRERHEQKQYYPQPGWYEQDPEELFQLVVLSIRNLIQKSGIQAESITAIGLDHQGETCLIWEKDSGKPVYPAITWQDRRPSERISQLTADQKQTILNKTGLIPNAYTGAPKLRWILDNIPNGQQRAENGELLAGNLNTWVIWKLTGGRSFISDISSAELMLLFDPRSDDWDTDLLRFFDIPRQMLPELHPCVDDFGKTNPELFAGTEIPIRVSIPDSYAGMAGNDAIHPGILTTSYGTGCFMHLVTGETFPQPRNGLTASCCFADIHRRIYQLNGIGYTAGSAIKWLINGIGILENEKESSAIAMSVPDTHGVTFVPAFSGLATPFWDEDARGAFTGLTAGVTRAHLIRAVLESIALQTALTGECMRETADTELTWMLAIGGITANEFLMQFQADLLEIPIRIPEENEPSFGAARLTWSPETTEKSGGIKFSKVYLPRMSETERLERIQTWKNTVEKCLTNH